MFQHVVDKHPFGFGVKPPGLPPDLPAARPPGLLAAPIAHRPPGIVAAQLAARPPGAPPAVAPPPAARPPVARPVARPLVLTLTYDQLHKFYKIIANQKKPNYWVSEILFINYNLGTPLDNLMKLIRTPEKDTYLTAITQGGFKHIFDFNVALNGIANKYIIKFESMSKWSTISKWCYDLTECSFIPTVIRSDKYKDNYTSTPDNVKTSRICIIKTPSQIVEAYFSLLNTKYFVQGVSPCLLKTYFNTIIENNECIKKDIQCFKTNIGNDVGYNTCLGNSCENIPQFNTTRAADTEENKNFIDGRYVATIQEKIDGDLMFLRNSIPDGFTTISFITTLLHISITLHILQVKNRLMHNDFWFRNIFFCNTQTNQRNCIDGKSNVEIPLNQIKYYHYDLVNTDGTKINIYLGQQNLLPIISDFGFSEFFTDDGEYIENGDFGNRNPCKQIPNNPNNIIFLWYSDIILFLTTTLHTLFNNSDDDKYSYRAFVSTWQLGTGNTTQIIGEIHTAIINNDKTNRQRNIIITIILSLLSIFYDTTINQLIVEFSKPGNSLMNILNTCWSTYFYPDETSPNLFELWLLHSNHKSIRLNMKNFGKPEWRINNNYKTILPFVLNLFNYYKGNPVINDQLPRTPEPINAENVLNIVLDKSIPKYTDNLEKSLDEYKVMMGQSFKPPPQIKIGEISYGPSYIKPIDKDSKDSQVIYYSYQNIPIPGISNTTDGDGSQYAGEEWKQFINLIVIKNLNEPNNESKISFERKKLMKTLIEIFKTENFYGKNSSNETTLEDNTDYVKTDWGIAFSGGFFKHIDYTSPDNWKHCNNIKNDTPEQVKTTKCFQPIGYTREKYRDASGNYVNNTQQKYNPVPDLYRDVYGSVCLSGLSGEVKIIQPYLNNSVDHPECNYVLASGPILMMEGRRTFTSNLIRNPIYQGSMQNQATMNPYIMGNDGRKKMLYLAGWLNHAFNLNPRAAFGIDGNGNILLVTVEGRNQRGNGCDLSILGKIMQSFGCVSAVNLDGGGTADLLYKLPNCGCYVETNPVHRYKYPLMSLENSTSFVFKKKKLQLAGKKSSNKKTKRIKNKKNKSRRCK
jgi:hypothetical protein